MSEAKWYLRTQDETFGPESEEKLDEWARMGRIQPGQEVSEDNIVWRRVEDVPMLDMRFSIDLGDGNPRGPFNRAAAEALIASGRLPRTATMVETRAPFDQPEEPPKASEEPAAAEEPATVEEVRAVVTEPPSVPQVQYIEKIVEVPVEKIVEKEVRIEVPVEKIVEVEKVIEVEKIVEKEVPVEVEKIIEKRVEVPVEVEKIVEKIVEKVVVDESRVKELEGLLESERKHAAEQLETERRHAAEELDAARRHTAELQARMDAALKASAEREAAAQAKVVLEAREASARETKLREQVVALENEIRRLPQTASEIADIQAAVYSIMTNEANELGVLLEMERKDLDEFRRRHQERADRLQDRRRELLKRAGANIEDMTRRALINRPEDPRTAQLRKELDELRRLSERKALASEQQINDLKDRLRLQQTEQARAMEGLKDVTQLRAEAQALREKLQLREKELMSERQQNEAMRQQQAFKQQTLMTRLAALESPSIGTTQSLETNQSREAKLVKLPSWMRIHK